MTNDPESLAALARRHDPDRFLCALFAPAAARPALFGLIALNHELARAREVTRNPIAALIRLQWWRDALTEAGAGQPPRRHEVAGPLHALVASGAIDAAAALRLVDAREAEVEEGGFATREAFGAYLRASAGGLALAMAGALRVEEAAWPSLARIGALVGLAGILRNLPAHAAQGRCLLPGDALAELGLSPEAVMAEPDRAWPLRIALAEEGAAALAATLREAGSLPPEARPVSLLAVLARLDLRRMAAGRPVPAPRGIGAKLAVLRAVMMPSVLR
jgi:phytoene synthase